MAGRPKGSKAPRHLSAETKAKLQARKELGKPVRYIRGRFENEFDVAIMNANRKNWPMTAYLNFHIENGKKDYQIIKAMTKQYSLPLECAIFLLAGGYSMWRETRNDFKQGKFKIKTLQRCNRKTFYC